MRAVRIARLWTAIAVLLSSTLLTAQWLNYPTSGIPRTSDGKPNLSAPPPRGSDGHPDLSGIWGPVFSLPHIPPGTIIESSQGPQFSLQWFRKDAAPLPMTPWAAAIFKEHDRKFGADRPSGHCLPHGIPDAMIPDIFKIVQHPGLTLILYEEFARFRQIFTDGRPHPKDMNPAWLGYSIGRWDGDVFMVDTVGFNDQSWLDDIGHPHSDQLHTFERFRRLDVGRMEVEITIDDPKAYTEPWSVMLHLGLRPDTELIEDVCDNEKDVRHSVGPIASTGPKRPSVVVPPSVLQKYVGSYVLSGFAGAYEVYLVNGRFMALGGDLTAVSQTEFLDNTGATIRFVMDSQGNVTHIVVEIVGDELTLTRQPTGGTGNK